MSSKSVLVIGDTILDVSVFSSVVGISLETPTLKAKKRKEVISPGGAANVAKNITALGTACTFLTVLKKDTLSFWTHDLLTRIVFEEEREDTIKSRYWVSRGDSSYKHLQINQGCSSPISKDAQEDIIEYLSDNVTKFKCVLFVDYQQGIFSSPSFVSRLIGICKNQKVPCIASSQTSSNDSRHRLFKGSDLVVMNRDEAVSNDSGFKDSSTVVRLEELLGSNICVTLGSLGSMIGFSKESVEYVVPAFDVNAIDTCGAGDAFLACLSTKDWKNNPQESLKISNAWAALATEKLGTTVPELRELDALIEGNDAGKIQERTTRVKL